MCVFLGEMARESGFQSNFFPVFFAASVFPLLFCSLFLLPGESLGVGKIKYERERGEENGRNMVDWESGVPHYVVVVDRGLENAFLFLMDEWAPTSVR